MRRKPVSPASTGFVAEVSDIVRTMALVLVLALVPRVVVCQPFTIPSASMEPTLLVGDYIVVSKYPYGWSRHSVPLSPPLGEGRLLGQSPRRGDIVVFKKPSDGQTDIIKRLVGLPGDRLQVVGGVLRINDKPVSLEPLSASVEPGPFGAPTPVTLFRETLPNGRAHLTKGYGPDTPQANTGVYVVPAGCYFMMGDNRDDSVDSRFDPGQIAPGQSACPWNHELDRFVPPELGMGFVPFDNLVGRADLVLFSWRPGASLLKPWTLVSGLRWERTFQRLGAAPTS